MPRRLADARGRSAVSTGSGPNGYAATDVIWDAAGNSLSDQLDAEAVTQQALGQTADYAEECALFLPSDQPNLMVVER